MAFLIVIARRADALVGPTRQSQDEHADRAVGYHLGLPRPLHFVQGPRNDDKNLRRANKNFTRQDINFQRTFDRHGFPVSLKRHAMIVFDF